MQARVRMLIDEATAAFWTDVQVKAEINDAQIVVARDTEELITYYDYETADGEQQYALPADYLKMKMVQIERSTGDWDKLEYKNQKQWFRYTDGSTTREGIPEVYKLELGSVDKTDPFPGDIYLWPIPDTTYNMKLHFYQIPTELVATTDTSELPEMAHKAVVYRAAADLLLKAKELALSDRIEVRFEKEMFAIRKSYARLQRDKTTTYEDYMGYTRTRTR
jgi:hypothetical protein